MFVRSLSLGVAAAALLAGGAQAADLIIPTTPEPIYEAAGFDWEGLYIGARAGGQFTGAVSGGTTYAGYPASTTSPEPIYAPAGFDWEGLYVGVRAGGQFTSTTTDYANYPLNATSGVLGAAVGVNFIPVDPFLIGAEVTGDYIWNNAFSTGEFFANLRAGAVVTDSVLVYAIGGIGTNNRTGSNVGVYQAGAGVELAVTDSITVRGEVVAQGDFDGAADAVFEGAKATVGVFYHF